MRTWIVAFAVILVMAIAGPAGAQTRQASNSEYHSPSINIDLGTVGGGIFGLVTASGLLNLYNAGSLMFQGAPFAEAIEIGSGLPMAVAVLTVIAGGYFGQDMVRLAIAPLFNSSEPVKVGR